MKLSLIFIAALFVSACTSKPVNITGDVFVATQGAGSYKLGAVKIIAITEKDFKSQFSINEPQINTAKNNAEKRLKDCPFSTNHTSEQISAADIDTLKKWRDQAQCSVDVDTFRRVGVAIVFGFKSKADTVSNADGKFTITLPANESYILLAQATRKVGDTDEQYEWMEPVKVTTDSKNIVLTNTNIRNPEMILNSL